MHWIRHNDALEEVEQAPGHGAEPAMYALERRTHQQLQRRANAVVDQLQLQQQVSQLQGKRHLDQIVKRSLQDYQSAHQNDSCASSHGIDAECTRPRPESQSGMTRPAQLSRQNLGRSASVDTPSLLSQHSALSLYKQSPHMHMSLQQLNHVLSSKDGWSESN